MLCNAEKCEKCVDLQGAASLLQPPAERERRFWATGALVPTRQTPAAARRKTFMVLLLARE